METNQGGRWSVREAESAIIAAFVLKADSIQAEKVSMRFKDLREALNVMERGKEIAPKTLSRALKDLGVRGRLSKERIGREAWYSLERIPRRDMIPIFAETDRAAILSAANVGAVGDAEAGWAFYGIPDLLRRKVRSSLEAEAAAFQIRIERVLERQLRAFMQSLLRSGKGRLSARELADAERGLSQGLQVAAASGGLYSMAVFLDQVAPGASGRVLTGAQARWPSTREAQIRYLAQATGKSEVSIEKAVRSAERSVAASRKLFAAIPTRDRVRFAREFGAWTQLIASWCAVVR